MNIYKIIFYSSLEENSLKIEKTIEDINNIIEFSLNRNISIDSRDIAKYVANDIIFNQPISSTTDVTELESIYDFWEIQHEDYPYISCEVSTNNQDFTTFLNKKKIVAAELKFGISNMELNSASSSSSLRETLRFSF